MQLTIVDVFAERPYEGNQLAVIRCADALDTARMQAIAREMNFSETTFVLEESPGRARVRIFTPGEELPFAGHPTLGTAWVLTGGTGRYVLELAAGAVPVEFREGVAWLTPPAAEFGPELEPADAATLLGVTLADLDLSVPPRLVRCGPWAAIVQVGDLEALRRVQVTRESQTRLGVPDYTFAFCSGAYSVDAQYAARMMFFDGISMREDPATGGTNAGLAQYLHRLGTRGRFAVEQGFEIRRPSRIYLHLKDTLDSQDSAPDAPVAVGGRVQPVAEGRLL